MAGDIGELAGVGDVGVGDIVEPRAGMAAGTDPLPRYDAATELPLCVDLDGTLVRTDTLHEQYLGALVRHPLAALLLLLQLARGKAAFKRGLSRLCPVNPESLPYQTDLVEFLRHEKARGRKLVLATASDR